MSDQPLFDTSQHQFARLVAQIIECNPFLPERIEFERDALGADFVEQNANWNLHPHEHQQTENLARIHDRAQNILRSIEPTRLATANSGDLDLFVDLVSLVLFNEFRDDYERLDQQHGKGAGQVYKQFQKAWQGYLPPEVVTAEITDKAPHLFAMLFQIRRAFNNTFRHLIGSSQAIIALRADVWRSIFTCDVRRFSDTLYRAMADFPTLITGPTGSGKELVARAIGLSSYISFDTEAGQFAAPLQGRFASLNLSAISPQLIESALFGHVKGAFTGAAEARVGWLESCPLGGAVFLDEIGELGEEIQVKLLRVVQDRVFHRLGDVKSKRFAGRIIAATNRNLDMELQHGRFRKDFYYRLCADRINTPSLAERTHSDPQELAHLVHHLAARITQQDHASDVAKECLAWIEQNLGENYPWPGNVRELDQCIRSWLIRRHYLPCHPAEKGDGLEAVMAEANLTADELLSLYCRVKYEQNGSYLKTAQQLGLDRRTIKSRVDSATDA